MTLAFNPAVPVFRIFSVEKVREFYQGFLGFMLDWEHRFEPDAPVYMQVSRGPLILHLSEHHGDATPGSTAYVRMRGAGISCRD
jgi:ribosomal-protein-alanine N-acetyltransferase